MVILTIIFARIANTSTFLHFIDSLADWLYKLGSKPDGIYCRKGKRKDVLYSSYDYYTSLLLFHEVIKKMSEIDPNPSFIIYTGDMYIFII